MARAGEFDLPAIKARLAAVAECEDKPSAVAVMNLVELRAHYRTDLAALVEEVEAMREALEKSVKLQSHYATMINMHDGGERITFDSAQAWLDRLAALRGKP